MKQIYLFFISFLSLFSLFFIASTQGVFAATVTLSPAAGVSGMEVFVTGTGFANSSPLAITWDGNALTTTPASITSTGTGAVPTDVSFVVPSTSASFGTHIVRVSSSAQVYSTATFTISTPTLVVASPTIPATGLPIGVPITVAGTNFSGNQSTTVYFDSTLVATTTSSVTGGFQATFDIPLVNNTGTHLIRAINNTSSIANLTILVATPSLVLTPVSAPAGFTVTVTGTNFMVNSPVTFLFNETSLTVSPSVTANGAGSFSTTFVVPDIAQGTATVKALTNSSLYATAVLTIPTPTLTLTPNGAATAPILSGLPVNIFGTNFKTNSQVRFYVNNIEVFPDGSPIFANNQGEFGCNLIFPTVPFGVSTLKAVSYTNLFAANSLTISPSAIVLSPNAGTVGIPIFISGTGFEVSKSVIFTIDGITLSDSPLTNTVGSFYYQLQLPTNLSVGVHTIKAKTNDQNVTTAAYTVTAPVIAVNPAAGAPGSVIYITGTNYEPNKEVSLNWNGSPISFIGAPLISSSSGTFTGTFTVPSNASQGTQQILVSTSSNISALSSFTITAPTLSLSQSSGFSGMKVTFNGANLPANTSLSFSWDGDYSVFSQVSTITSSSGAFSEVITIPSGSKGNHTIAVSVSGSTELIAASQFSLNTPSIQLAVYSGQPSSKFILSGYYFEQNKEITLTWDNRSETILTKTIVKTDSVGAFTTEITIPQNSSKGIHTIEARTSVGIYATSIFTVVNGNINLSDSNGSIGKQISISGSDFDPNTLVTVIWDGITIKPLIETKTDGIGGFKLQIIIPDVFPGDHTLQVSTSQFSVSTSTFVVNRPKLTVSPEAVGIGGNLFIHGEGFAPNKSVYISIGNYKISTDFKTDSAGNFDTTVRMPLVFGESVTVTAKTGDFDNSNVSYSLNSLLSKAFRIVSTVSLTMIFLFIALFIFFMVAKIKFVGNILANISNLRK
jgi:hypothetical protein